MKNPPKAIINGDDFGYSKGVNLGIIKAYKEDILTSTSVLGNILIGNESLKNLSNMSGIQKPPIGIGAHFNLTYDKPCVQEIWNNRNFTRPHKGLKIPEEWQGSAWEKYYTDYPKEKVKKEFLAQIKRMGEILGKIDHVDNHHSVASFGAIKDVYEEVAKELSVPARAFAIISENATYGGEFIVDKKYALWARKKGIKTVDSQDMIYYYNENDPITAFCEATCDNQMWGSTLVYVSSIDR